jgi:hypothetical protein
MGSVVGIRQLRRFDTLVMAKFTVILMKMHRIGLKFIYVENTYRKELTNEQE